MFGFLKNIFRFGRKKCQWIGYPPGVHYIEEALHFSDKRIKIHGAGIDKTILVKATKNHE